ncbi:hypothetical protein [Coralliovum pocilloporae]|uniref:hypothetical protein n=1 Tax=Coralliovum pocilloporae TaxID=3066369 RepID=UPI00330789DB
MQPTVLAVALVLMAALALIFWRAVRAANGSPPDINPDRLRTRLIWALTIAGVIISVASLREWPHATASESEAFTVSVTGGQWWWEIDQEQVPLGQPINFDVTTEDVTHGMGIYNSDMRLLVQTQAIPGYTSTITYTFTEPGTYQILCLEYCGVAHHDMINSFTVSETTSSEEKN